MNSLFSFENLKELILVAVLCPKNLVISQKYCFAGEGCSPLSTQAGTNIEESKIPGQPWYMMKR